MSRFTKFKLELTKFTKSLPSLMKYQILTSLLIFGIVVPVFWTLTSLLIEKQGYIALSNSLIFKFLITPYGLVFLLMIFLILILGILLEIFGFITISARGIQMQAETSFWSLVKYNFKYLRKFFTPSGILLLLYLVLLVPLTGAGLSLSFLTNVKIPAFIRSWIFSNKTYSIIYVAVVVVMFLIAIRWLFTFHFMSIAGFNVRKSMKESSKLIRKYPFRIIWRFILLTLALVSIVMFAIIIWMILVAGLIKYIGITTNLGRILSMAMIFVQNVIMSLGYLVLIPAQMYALTDLFYKLIAKDEKLSYLSEVYPPLPPKTKLSFIDKVLARRKTLAVLFVIVLLLFSIPSGIFFHEIFTNKSAIQIIAHRAGGVHAAENTIRGLNLAIEKKADWTEIDVQRTADGQYILNHDNTFKRLTGDNRKSSEMTYEEISKLGVRNLNNPASGPEKVPKLEEVLDVAKDKIGLFIELKGETADIVMVDDVVKMIKDKNMINQTVIVCFDYNLISYIEDKYPEIYSGYIYYLALGEIGNFKSDVLIIEEDVATEKTIIDIQTAGKMAVVWTVNSADAINQFIKYNADAIITDQIDVSKRVVEEYNNRSDRDIISEMLLFPK